MNVLQKVSDNFDLMGRVVIVTGGAVGIGASIAELLASAGATVVIADRDAAASATHSAALVEAGGRATSIEMDIADERSVVQAIGEICAIHGAPWAVVN